ncbi:MAG: hypothetical protein AAGB12_03385 [Pseudomonadota bacterium]
MTIFAQYVNAASISVPSASYNNLVTVRVQLNHDFEDGNSSSDYTYAEYTYRVKIYLNGILKFDNPNYQRRLISDNGRTYVEDRDYLLNAAGNWRFELHERQYIEDCREGYGCVDYEVNTSDSDDITLQAPSVPASMTVPSNDYDGTFAVSWPSSTGTTRYELERRQSNGSWQNIYSGNALNRTITGLPQAHYDFRVRACNSYCSNYRTSGKVNVFLTPNNPASIRVPSYHDASVITINWATATGPVAVSGYQLERKTDNGGFVQIYSGTAVSFTDNNLSHNTHYTYRIKTCNGNYCSNGRESGQMLVVYRPGIPTSISVSPQTSESGNGTISWSTTSFASSYTIKVTSDVNTQTFTTSSNTYGLSGFENGQYDIAVRACNSQNTCSQYSTNISWDVNRNPDAPSLSGPVSTATGEFNLQWTPISLGSAAIRYRLIEVTNNDALIYSGTALQKEIQKTVNQTYCYRVRAESDFGQSPYSNQHCVEVTRPSIPNTPVLDGPSRTELDYELSWQAVDYAANYHLFLTLYNENDEVIQTESLVYSGSDTQFTYSGPEIYGRHVYRIYASNVSGDSLFSSPISIKVEPDPTVIIRKQLYYQEADAISANEENLSQNRVSRDLAAFRYLDLMYGLDEEKRLVNHYIDGDFLRDFAELYSDQERARIARVYDLVLEQLALYPNNDSVQQLILDIYYDRAAAELVLINQAWDDANISRLREEPVTIEADIANEALHLSRNALDVYWPVINDFDTFIQDWTQQRGQTSPRYFDDDNLAQPVIADQNDLFKGYKDLVMAYTLMTRLIDANVRVARLQIISGQTNETINQLMLEHLTNLESELMDKFQAIENLVENAATFGQEIFEDDTAINGLPQAYYRFQAALTSLQNTQAWFQGETNNYLGLPFDVALIIGGYGIEGNNVFDSFDAMKDMLNPDSLLSPINTAIQALDSAEISYDNFRGNQDRLATEYNDRNRQLNDQLFELLGWDYPAQCREASCIIQEESAIVGSLISRQVERVDTSLVTLEKQVERLSSFKEHIQNTVEEWGERNNILDAKKEVIIRYGDMQADIQVQIAEIEAKIESSNKKVGFLKDIVSLGLDISKFLPIGGGDGDEDKDKVLPVASTIKNLTSLVGKIAQGNSKIRAIKKIGELQASSERLAAAERAELLSLNGLELELDFQQEMRRLLLEQAALELSIIQATSTLVQESDLIEQYINQATRLATQIEETNEQLTKRFFADPIHARRLTASMERAELHFRVAQEWMLYMTNALEYKWAESFLGSNGMRKSGVLQLRTSEDLIDYFVELVNFDLRRLTTAPTQQTRDVFSIKKDALKIDPNDDLADEKFQEALENAVYQNFPFFIGFEFDTFSSTDDNLFKGPIFLEQNGKKCVFNGGNYLNKIESIAINISTKNASSLQDVSAFISYGGTSVMRTSTVSLESTEEGGIVGSIRQFTPWFTRVSPDNTFEFSPNVTVNMTATLNDNEKLSNELYLLPDFTLKERAVATSEWVLSIQWLDLYTMYELFSFENIDDIEIIFEHRYRTRYFDQELRCNFGFPGGFPFIADDIFSFDPLQMNL